MHICADAQIAGQEMPVQKATSPNEPKRLNFFERYLTLWVLVCMVLGVALGRLLPGFTARLSSLEFGEGSQVNVPIAVLIWLMIFPMMLKIDFGALGGIAKKTQGPAGYPVRELAGEAVQHGVPGMGFHSAPFLALDRP